MDSQKFSLLRSLSAYLPGFLVERIMAQPDCIQGGWNERTQAALLFSDVSGFTRMSETLGRLGKEGSEELTRVLNAYFTAMIDLVHAYGGQVVNFGGDALTAQFDAGSGDLASALQRACTCALAMQQKMAAFGVVHTQGGEFELRMKIGISAGQVLSMCVGEPAEGLEYAIAGSALDRMGLAEHHAKAGEVLVEAGCLAQAGVTPSDWGLTTAEAPEGFLSLTNISRPAQIVPARPLEAPSDPALLEQAITRLVPFLPASVYEQILEGQRQYVGEHRRVVSLFVNFEGIDYDSDPEAVEKLQVYFTTVQRIIHQYGGRLNWMGTGDKGSLLHIIFGAPVAHEDNEPRAASCALEIQQRVRGADGLGFITGQRIGIAAGYVFAGDVGSEMRREYTVMGDVVNLSARLMQAAAWGEILLESRAHRRAGKEVLTEELPPIQVKGKSEPVPVYRLLGTREPGSAWTEGRLKRHDTPMVGRTDELAQISDIAAMAAAGHGQLLVIRGEAGVGKTRLLEEWLASTAGSERAIFGGECLSYGSQTPYLPWISLLKDFFGITQSSEATESRIDKITRRMAQVDPALQAWAPLLGQLLGLPMPENEIIASLDPQIRKQRTFDLVLALLRGAAQQTPLLMLIFEDLHGSDTISLELLNYVARNIAKDRIMLVAIYRPTFDLDEWKRHPGYNLLELTDLPAEEALQMVRLKLGVDEVPPVLRERLLRGEERVNPFFVEEVLNSLIDRGYIVPQAAPQGYILAGDLAEAEVPASLQAPDCLESILG